MHANTNITWMSQEVYIAGLVTEVCIRATTLHALKEGYATVAVVKDACRGMTWLTESAIYMELRAQGAHIVSVQDCS